MKIKEKVYINKEEYKRLKTEGYRDKDIARIFGIAYSTLYRIKKRKKLM